MIFVDHLGLLKTPHIECVAVRVLVANDDVHGLLWVPADRSGLVLQVHFLKG